MRHYWPVWNDKVKANSVHRRVSCLREKANGFRTPLAQGSSLSCGLSQPQASDLVPLSPEWLLWGLRAAAAVLPGVERTVWLTGCVYIFLGGAEEPLEPSPGLEWQRGGVLRKVRQSTALADRPARPLPVSKLSFADVQYRHVTRNSHLLQPSSKLSSFYPIVNFNIQRLETILIKLCHLVCQGNVKRSLIES